MSVDAEKFAGFGPNEWLVLEMYQSYLKDPNSVDKAWWDFFADYSPASAPVTSSSPPPAGSAATPATPTGATPAGSATPPAPEPAPQPTPAEIGRAHV